MHDAAERIARESYGRLVAILAARTRDVAAAEDALADAFAAALTAWPAQGAPDNPEAWLIAAAKRKLIDAARRAAVAEAGAPQLLRAIEEAESVAEPLPDRRLALMFACAHPAIDAGAHTPLMLQAVLGLSAERIAAAYLVTPQAMSQRLVRAKRGIREAEAAFELPPPEAWHERAGAVRAAIYTAFNEGWEDASSEETERRALTGEAIWLARVLSAQMPDDAETLGLLSLMLHIEARRPARRDAEGRFAPLSEQDVRRWDEKLIADAEAHLSRASRLRRPGRYQLEAAIQSVHAARRVSGLTDWPSVAMLYEALAALTGSDVARLNHAAALEHVAGPHAALAALDALEAPLRDYQPFWALRAHLAARLGRAEAARAAYGEAIARARDPAVRAFLEARRDAL